jgi:putative NADPH-quinone reductase
MASSPTILVLFAHLATHRSRINRAMVEAIRGLDRVVLHDLLETYPDFYIDVEEEQRLLKAADLVVFHFPVYWYSSPAILKHWEDLVLTRGFAYGEGGTALHGKDFMLAISTGALPEAYRPQGIHGYPLEVFLRPFEQTARLCGMNWLPPFVLQGGHSVSDEQIEAHAREYRALLERYQPSAGMATAARG